MNKSSNVIQLGDPSLSHFEGQSLSQIDHPTGMSFYSKRFTQTGQRVEFLYGRHSFTVDHVFSATGAADKHVPGGIYGWSILFGLTDQEADTPEAARDSLMRFFSTLRAAGWSRFIQPHRPRLVGQQAWQYGTSGEASEVYSLDSTYMPKLEEWRATELQIPQWIFYADGVYLEVTLKSSAIDSPAGKRIYLVSANVKNEFEFYGVDYFSGDTEKIRSWKLLISAELAKHRPERLKAEERLKALGYTIDTTYQDPQIQALQQSPHR